MNYKETLFFVGKCLTINHEEHNRKIVEREIISGNVDWDNVVKLSTEHYVFSALYCNLKRAQLLSHLPEELVNYMQHITDLNRERNHQIIEQAKEINELLLANDITPIFLKGTGNLLEGLYQDLGERMVGDIDFIVSKDNYIKTAYTLENFGYTKVHDTTFDFPSFKHYPRMQKAEKIAAIEIHKELLIEKYANDFNYLIVEKDILNLESCSFLSYKNQLVLSIIAKQINDDGKYFNDIALRNAYDAFLLSLKVDSLESIENFKELFNPLNNFIALCQSTLNSNFLKFKKTNSSQKSLFFYTKLLGNPKLRISHYKRTKNKLFFWGRLKVILKSFYNKEYRIWLYKRIINGRQKLD